MLLLFSDNLAKAFYAWIQVRNIGAVEKGDVGRARLHYERVLQLKTFRAWLYSQVSYVLSQWKAQETHINCKYKLVGASAEPVGH